MFASGYDTIIQRDQSIPAEKLINEIFAASTDGKKVTAADWSRIRTTRLAHSKQTNGQFSLTTTHALFGAGKYVAVHVTTRSHP